MRSRPTLFACLMLCIATDALSAEATDVFGQSIAPILTSRCLGCHNDERRQGDLSLSDPRELVRQNHVVPGSAADSDLVHLITPIGGEARMPKESAALSQDQRLAIDQWIREGAFIAKNTRLEPPDVADLNWWSLVPIPRHSPKMSADRVDQFLADARDQEGIATLGPADPETLIRRLTFDLHGLPPTPEEIDSYVADDRRDSEGAWKRLVDRLLAAPEFGEKLGQHWLDIARYAETHGYDKDQPRRNAWPYRDYVIDSLNRDKPFTRFVREQIAGDVLADDSSQGIVATGFLAAGPWDLIAHQEVGESKLDGRIAKHLDRDEMLAAVFNVFMSTTVQCARCHDHKFDPIRSEGYYRGQAVFAGIDRADRIYRGLSDPQSAKQSSLQESILQVKRERDAYLHQLDTQITKQTSRLDEQIDAILDRIKKGTIPSRHGFHSTIAASQNESKWVQVDLGTPHLLGTIELLACYDDFNDIGAGFGFPLRFKLETSVGETFDPETAEQIADQSRSDLPNPLGFAVRYDLHGKRVRHIRLTATKLAERRDDFILALGELRALALDGTTNYARKSAVTASDSFPTNARWAPEFLVDERFHRWRSTEQDADELRRLQKQKRAIVDASTSADHQQRVAQWNERLAALTRQLDSIPKGEMAFAVASRFEARGQFKPAAGKNRPIHLLRRGDLRSPVKRVYPGGPRLWPEAPTHFIEPDQQAGYDEAAGRAALAQYVCHEDNPLLWRSIANRVWQWVFGNPLVATPNDFGRMGARPAHPRLLDALAASLRDDPDQSLKSLVRSLVSTRTYRLASTAPDQPERMAGNLAKDAENRWLWRANRRRMTAEEYRDCLLSISGVLRRSDRGGPSFQDFVIERPQHSPHYEYVKHDPNDPASHRRTIYRFVVRSQPHPMLTTLDCADPSISVARRDESTTSLQALAQWNNPLIEAMADTMAKHITRSGGQHDSIDRACRSAWGRPPEKSERDALQTLWDTHGVPTVCRVLFNSSALIYIE